MLIDVVLSDYPFPGFLDPVRLRAAEFERAHPQYRIQITGCHYEEIPAEIDRRAMAGTPPTIASYYSGASQQAIDTRTKDGRPLFTPIARALAGRTSVLGERVMLDDLIPACREFYTFGGEIAAVPLTLSTMVLYTNTTVLKAAGIGEPPQTWAELTDACQAVAALENGPQYPVTWPNDGKLFQQAVAQQGGLLLDQENGRTARAARVDLTSDAMMAYVHWWQQLHSRGWFLDTGVFEDWVGTITAFSEQRVALRVGSSFEVDFMLAAGRNGGFEVAVTPLPYNEMYSPSGNWIGGDALWLADGLDPEVQDGALAFIQYLNSPENNAAWHRATGSAPITRTAIEVLEREGWFTEHPQHKVATRQLARHDGTPGSNGPVYPGSHGVQHAIMRAMRDVLSANARPAPRFARAAVEAQAALDAYNATCLGSAPRDPSWRLVGS